MANNNLNNPPVKGDDLLAYLNNELSKAEKHKLEEQMLEDEFLADATEGLGMVKDKAALAANIAAINASLNTTLNSTGTAPTRSFLSIVGNTAAIAATITLLIGTAYFISQYTSPNKESAQKTLAENKTEHGSQPQFAPLNEASQPPTEESSVKADSVAVTGEQGVKKDLKVNHTYTWSPAYGQAAAVADEPVSVSDGDSKQDLYIPTAPDMNATKNVDLDLSKYGPASNQSYNNQALDYRLKSKDIKATGATYEKVKPEKKNKARTEAYEDVPGVYMDGVLIKKDNDDKATVTQSDNPTRSTVTGKKENTTDEATTKAMGYYKNGDYKGALNEFETILKKEPGNSKGLYYSGMANKYLGKEAKALDFYTKVPANSTYYENAQWEIAQIYKAQKKNAQAINALQQVINVNGALKTRAEKLITELQGNNK